MLIAKLLHRSTAEPFCDSTTSRYRCSDAPLLCSVAPLCRAALFCEHRSAHRIRTYATSR